MLLEPNSQLDSTFVYLVAVASIVMTWEVLPFLPSFRFGRSKDVGITIYLSLVSLWFYLSLSPTILAPLFFADPAAAIVGKTLSSTTSLNPKWYSNKTVAGSLVVAVVTYFTVQYECTVQERVLIAVLAAVGEAAGGEFDNAVIGLVVIGGWFVFGQ
jgi:hypothetical protein